MAVCEFGFWLKTELMRKHMTQRELAKKTNIDEKVMCDIVHGRNTKQEHKDKICLVLSSET
ncbi:MAG: helix-turn-helix transcriptional regulator [Lachnospiraceae bacterium]|nr:helix-turn-helix transcriptional regulator [Lachnospiraceae bacterium]